MPGMTSPTRTIHVGLQTIRATAWAATGGQGWHWSVCVAAPGHSRSGPASTQAAASIAEALDEAERQGHLMLETDWAATAVSAA